MALDDQGYAHIQRQIDYYTSNVDYIPSSIIRKIYDTLQFYFRSLFLLPYWVFVCLVRLVDKQAGRALGITFSRTLLKHYFLNKGLDSVWVNKDAPQSFTKPTLILALRDDPMSAHYIHSIFSGTVIIPILSYMKKFGTLPTPFNTLGSLMNASTYPDQPLPVAADNVKTLLKKGYPTVAFINKDFAHSSLNNKLGVYADLLALTQIPHVDVYLLSNSGITDIQRSTRQHTCYVANKLYPLKEVLCGHDLQSIYGINRFGEFFGFRFVEMLG
jgi:hypothetical protein